MMVIDEADHMIDKNFEKVMDAISCHKPESCQTALFCADFPTILFDKKNKFGITKSKIFTDCVKKVMKDYVYARVGIIQACPKLIKQKFVLVNGKQTKFDALKDILVKEEGKKIAVFVDRRKDSIELSKILCKMGHQVTVFHGMRSQSERQFALWQFNEGKKNIMICTSVSARGLDFYELDIVVNYDLPKSTVDSLATYKYRIGRSGRAGNEGKAIALFTVADSWLADALVIMLGKSQQTIPDWLVAMCGTKNIIANQTDISAMKLAAMQAAVSVSEVYRRKYEKEEIGGRKGRLTRIKVEGHVHEVLECT